MKIIKIGAAVIAFVLVLFTGAVAYFAATFDPNEHRERAVALVKEKTGRDLRIDGDIKLTFFPRLGVALGAVSLSERPAGAGGPARPTGPGATAAAPPAFAQIDAAEVSLRIMPLLTGKLLVDRVLLTGLAVELVHHADGSTNFDDLTGKDHERAKPDIDKPHDGAFRLPIVDIAGIELTGARVGWRDERDGSSLRLANFELRTGRIAADVPGEVTLRARVEGTKPTIALNAELLTGYRFDPAARMLSFEGFAASVQGDAPGAKGLDANLSALTAALDGTAQKLELRGLRLRVRDATGRAVDLNAPQMLVAPDRVTGETMELAVTIDQPNNKLDAKVTLTAPTMRENRVAFDRLGAKIDLRQEGLSVTGELGTPLEADLGAKTVSLAKLAGAFQVSGPKLPPAGVKLEMNGSGGLDWGRKIGNADVSAKLDQSNVQAKLASRGFAPMVLDVALIADRLDLDRYLPAPAKTEPAPADAPVDLRGLAAFNGKATLRAGSITAKGVTASNLNVALRGGGGKLEVESLRAEVFRGVVQASARADAGSGALAANGALTNIEIGPLLREVASSDVLEGRGNARFNVASRGATVSALKRGLDGTVSLALRDGAVKGINLAAAIRKAKAAVGGGSVTQGASATEQTDFSALDASFVIKDGVARNDDLAMKSPLLRVGGAGSIDIGAGSIDYLLKTSIVGTLSGQGGRELESLRGVTIPVRISGPFEKLAYKLDMSSAVADAAKEKLRSRIEEKLGIGKAPGGTSGDAAKPALPQKPADLLKGLLGR